jgi:RNA polymerase sigma-70 factor (ECF subfamily)
VPDSGHGLSAVPGQDVSKLTDEQLMARARENPEGFRELITRYERPIYVMAYSMLGSPHDAEEVTQEAFLAIYRSAHLFRPELSFSSWLYTIASNLSKNVLRARKRKFLSLDVEGAPEPKDREEAGPLEILQNQGTRDAVAKALASLKSKYSLVLLLRYAEGCSYEEIGEQLGLTLSAVDTRLCRARKMLREKLERMGIRAYPL